jgi:UDP-3-O-[3-hydroxymyristoyl] glucosamine N-acyltransferase
LHTPTQRVEHSISVAQLVALCQPLKAQVSGDVNLVLNGVAPLSQATQQHLSFLANPRYAAQVANSKAGAVVMTQSDHAVLGHIAGPGVRILCAKPYVFFAHAAQYFARRPIPAPGIHASAQVHPSAVVHPSACIEPMAVIGAGSHIMEGAYVGAHCVIGEHCVVGTQSWLYARVTLYEASHLGSRVVVHSGAVIGADGFGFANDEGVWVKIPQTGNVIIGDDCEIGANTTIDRGAMADTVIGIGVKIDNQVQIGHNVTVGDHTAIAGCVGIAGSTQIGRRVQLGGAAMIIGHLTIADDVVVSAASTVTRSITKPGFYTGIFPLDENAQWERNAVMVRNLDKMRQRLRQLEAGLNTKKDNQA